MKPKPFASLNHFTVPFATFLLLDSPTPRGAGRSALNAAAAIPTRLVGVPGPWRPTPTKMPPETAGGNRRRSERIHETSRQEDHRAEDLPAQAKSLCPPKVGPGAPGGSSSDPGGPITPENPRSLPPGPNGRKRCGQGRCGSS